MMSKEYRDAVTDNADGLTPWMRYCYDGLQSVDGGACEAVAGGVARSIGRLTGVSSAASTYRIGSYDAVGRVTQSSQTTKRPPAGTAVNAALQYSYTAGGALRELVLPSQRKVTYQYDAAGRVSGMERGDAAAVESYASQMSYHPHGAMKSWRLGNGLVESQSYNTRLQVETMSLGSLWSLRNVYGGTANNGNVVGQEMSVPGVTLPGVTPPVPAVVYTSYEYL